MHAKFGHGLTVVSKKGGFMIMKLLQVCQDNTANNVSNCGGDPVTQLIVNVYQMIKAQLVQW